MFGGSARSFGLLITFFVVSVGIFIAYYHLKQNERGDKSWWTCWQYWVWPIVILLGSILFYSVGNFSLMTYICFFTLGASAGMLLSFVPD